MLYLFQTWSVRTYNIILRNMQKCGPVLDAKDAEDMADLVVVGLIRNAGLKVATELYRGAGLGVYNIYEKLGGRVEVDKIRCWCEYIDTEVFHAKLD